MYSCLSIATVDVTVVGVPLKITKNAYNQHLPNTVSVRPGGCVWFLPDLRLVAIVMFVASGRMVAIVSLLQHKPIGVASCVRRTHMQSNWKDHLINVRCWEDPSVWFHLVW